MLKKVSLLAAGLAFAALMVLNFQEGSRTGQFTKANLNIIIQEAVAQTEEDCDNWWWDCDELFTDVSAPCTCTVVATPGGVGGTMTFPGTFQACQSGGPDFCTPDLICSCGYI